MGVEGADLEVGGQLARRQMSERRQVELGERAPREDEMEPSPREADVGLVHTARCDRPLVGREECVEDLASAHAHRVISPARGAASHSRRPRESGRG